MNKALLIMLLTGSANSASYWHDNEKTPLMKACQNADIANIKILIKEGENVNAAEGRDQPHGGYPVLRFAIDSGSLEAVQILLEAGANPNDFTSSHKANDDCLARNLSLLCHAIDTYAPIKIIQALLDKGADAEGVTRCYGGDITALMIAAHRGYTEAAIALLTAGADKSKVNKYTHKTALDYAKEQKHQAIIKLLENQI